MADNSVLNLGSGGDTSRSVQKGGAAGPKSQTVIIDRGGSGAEDLSPLDGVDITAPTAMPAGGVGIRGWLSAIWTKLNGVLSVFITGNGLVSTSNSSVTNLAAAAVFTGIAEDVTEYSSIVVSLFSSQASATDGLSIQQSPNNVDWDHTDVFTIPAATGKSFSVPVQGKFFRVAYTNGATLTTAFRLQTIYHKQAKKGSAVRPQDGRSNDNDFEEMLSYLMLFNGTAWERARGTMATGQLVEVSRINELRATTLWVSATGLSGAAVAASLPAAGVGLFHYITAIDIQLYATAARTGAAAPGIVTTANLPGTPAWNFPTAQAIGAIDRYDVPLLTPLKSSVANTATAISAPIATAGLWRINVGYYTAA